MHLFGSDRCVYLNIPIIDDDVYNTVTQPIYDSEGNIIGETAPRPLNRLFRLLINPLLTPSDRGQNPYAEINILEDDNRADFPDATISMGFRKLSLAGTSLTTRTTPGNTVDSWKFNGANSDICETLHTGTDASSHTITEGEHICVFLQNVGTTTPDKTVLVNISLGGSVHFPSTTATKHRIAVPTNGNKRWLLLRTTPSTANEGNNIITIFMDKPLPGAKPGYSAHYGRNLLYVNVNDGPDGNGQYALQSAASTVNEGRSVELTVRGQVGQTRAPFQLCATSSEADANEYGFGANKDKTVSLSFPDNTTESLTVELHTSSDDVVEPTETVTVSFCDGLNKIETTSPQLEIDIVNTNKPLASFLPVTGSNYFTTEKILQVNENGGRGEFTVTLHSQITGTWKEGKSVDVDFTLQPTSNPAPVLNTDYKVEIAGNPAGVSLGQNNKRGRLYHSIQFTPAGPKTVTLRIVGVDNDVAGPPVKTMSTSFGGSRYSNFKHTRGPTGAGVSIAILDDDSQSSTATLGWNLPNFAVAEINGPAEPVLTLSQAINTDVVFTWGIDLQYPGTATIDVDYSVPTYSTTIPAGSTIVDFEINMIHEGALEGSETVNMKLVRVKPSNRVSIDPARTSTTLTILDSDITSLHWFRSSFKINEADGSGGPPGLYINGPGIGSDIVVTFALADDPGTATLGTDYAIDAYTVTIPDGQRTASLPIRLLDDTLEESDETINLKIVSLTPSGRLGLMPPPNARDAVVTILGGEGSATLGLSASAYTVQESDASTGKPLIQLSSALPSVGAEVTFEINPDDPGTATLNRDYSIKSNPFMVPPGTTEFEFPIEILDDNLREGDETINFKITSTAPSAQVTLTSAIEATLTITDDAEDTEKPTSKAADAFATIENKTFTLGELSGAVQHPITIGNMDGRFLFLSVTGSATYKSDYTLEYNRGEEWFEPALVRGKLAILPIGSTTTLRVTPKVDKDETEGAEQIVVAVESIAAMKKVTPLPDSKASLRYGQQLGDIVHYGYTLVSNAASGKLTVDIGDFVKQFSFTLSADDLYEECPAAGVHNRYKPARRHVRRPRFHRHRHLRGRLLSRVPGQRNLEVPVRSAGQKGLRHHRRHGTKARSGDQLSVQRRQDTDRHLRIRLPL